MSKKIKSNKEKKVIILILCLIIVFAIWFSYKIFLLCYYDNNYNKKILNNYFNNSQKITVETDMKLANQNFLDMNYYAPRGAQANIPRLSFDTYKHTNLFPTLNSNQVFFKGINYKKVFDNYNINNPVDLIKNFKKSYKNNKNIFWHRNQMELKFLVEYFIASEINLGGINSKHYYFENDIEGHIIESSSTYKIYIYHNDNTYEITINKAFYDFDVVEKVLQSIYFE